jgi:SAM-dependent methyltransferase
MKRPGREYESCSPAKRPLLYDLAYNVFDIPAECDQLFALAGQHGLTRVRRMLDLGCGTGQYAAYLASLGISVTAIDTDRYMLSHARHVARQGNHGVVGINFVKGDMRERIASQRVDLCICLGASFNSLINDGDAARTLDAVGAALTTPGVFLLELHDPRATYGKDLTARWTVNTAAARVRGQFSMVPMRTGVYRWDIAVRAEFVDGGRSRMLMRTKARPWKRRDIERICGATGSMRLAGWHRVVEAGAAPRIIAAFTRAHDPVTTGRDAKQVRDRR